MAQRANRVEMLRAVEWFTDQLIQRQGVDFGDSGLDHILEYLIDWSLDDAGSDLWQDELSPDGVRPPPLESDDPSADVLQALVKSIEAKVARLAGLSRG